MNGHLNMYDPALHHNPIFGNIDNIEAFGFLVTRKNEKKPYFISAKLMNDSILSKIKRCRMKLEFVFLSGKSSPGNLKKKKFKTESRWLVHEMLTYRSKVWEVSQLFIFISNNKVFTLERFGDNRPPSSVVDRKIYKQEKY